MLEVGANILLSHHQMVCYGWKWFCKKMRPWPIFKAMNTLGYVILWQQTCFKFLQFCSKAKTVEIGCKISNSYKKLLTPYFDCTNKLHMLQRPQTVGKMLQTFSVRRVEQNPTLTIFSDFPLGLMSGWLPHNFFTLLCWDPPCTLVWPFYYSFSLCGTTNVSFL